MGKYILVERAGFHSQPLPSTPWEDLPLPGVPQLQAGINTSVVCVLFKTNPKLMEVVYTTHCLLQTRLLSPCLFK